MRSRLGTVAIATALVFLSAPAVAHADPPVPRYDLQVQGAGVTGPVGGARRINIVVQNIGSESTMPPDVELSPKRLLAVELPAGTQLAKDAAAICEAAVVQPADPRRFNCLLPTLDGRGSGIFRWGVNVDVLITGPVTEAGKATTSAFGPGTDLDTNRENDTAPIRITSVTGYDIMAVGATVSGKVGSVVQITVGVKNFGPDSAPSSGGSGAPKHSFTVVLPVGTELVDPSSIRCPPHGNRPVRPTTWFDCGIWSPIAPGESVLVTADVRITAVPSRQGTVFRTYSAFGPTDPERDLDINQTNNTAALTISTGELAQTGTDAKMIAAIGSGAVVVGGILLLMMRRFGSRRQ